MRDGLPLTFAPHCPCSGAQYFAGQDSLPFITDISLTARRAPAEPAAPLTDTMPALAAGIYCWEVDKRTSISADGCRSGRQPGVSPVTTRSHRAATASWECVLAM